jgi:hypothetical protein
VFGIGIGPRGIIRKITVVKAFINNYGLCKTGSYIQQTKEKYSK